MEYSSIFQNEFYKFFNTNCEIMSYYKIKEESFLVLKIYFLNHRLDNKNCTYLPFKFRKYNLKYLNL